MIFFLRENHLITVGRYEKVSCLRECLTCWKSSRLTLKNWVRSPSQHPPSRDLLDQRGRGAGPQLPCWVCRGVGHSNDVCFPYFTTLSLHRWYLRSGDHSHSFSACVSILTIPTKLKLTGLQSGPDGIKRTSPPSLGTV